MLERSKSNISKELQKKCFEEIPEIVNNYIDFKNLLKREEELNPNGLSDETRRKLYVENLKPKVISKYEELATQTGYTFVNGVLSTELIKRNIPEEEIKILKKSLSNVLGDEILSDLNDKISKKTLNDETLNQTMVSVLRGLNINGSELETILKMVTPEKKMEVFSYLKVYLESGDYKQDKPKDIEEIFEKINKRTLNQPNPFEKDQNKIVYNLSKGNYTDVTYINNKGELYAVDTTFSKSVGMENDSFLRHNIDIYYLSERAKLGKEKNVSPDKIAKRLKKEYEEILSGNRDESKIKNTFKDKSKEEQIRLLRTVNYKIIHNVDSKEENYFLNLGYIMEIFNKQQTSYNNKDITSFVLGLDFEPINSKDRVNYKVDKNVFEDYLKKIISEKKVKTNIFNILFTFEYASTLEENNPKKEEIKEILKKYLKVIRREKDYLNVGEELLRFNTSFNKTISNFNLEKEKEVIEMELEKEKELKNKTKTQNK